MTTVLGLKKPTPKKSKKEQKFNQKLFENKIMSHK